MGSVETLAQKAKIASRKIATLSTETKNDLICKIADALIARSSEILAENKRDLDAAQ